ncbi:hypothetical protein RFI_17169 [Reticulomyxa filosa]|uniref:Uncharacterized protein n=1 Tax=Reticulomyxa filosa TaxID=46433 RepID=X6N1V2_RETFI|nr:hypothetical protein RFI_17169 [Reticulomyxa filosa]|eukprot:ETO20051.1 hypothetical protein RFI_17169 [Reticulomyxa filosa]
MQTFVQTIKMNKDLIRNASRISGENGQAATLEDHAQRETKAKSTGVQNSGKDQEGVDITSASGVGGAKNKQMNDLLASQNCAEQVKQYLREKGVATGNTDSKELEEF